MKEHSALRKPLALAKTWMCVALVCVWISQAGASYQAIPNDCLLVAIRAKAAMGGTGDVIAIWWHIGGVQQTGHAVYVGRMQENWYIYDQKGSRVFGKIEGLHLALTHFVPKGVDSFSWAVIK